MVQLFGKKKCPECGHGLVFFPPGIFSKRFAGEYECPECGWWGKKRV